MTKTITFDYAELCKFLDIINSHISGRYGVFISEGKIEIEDYERSLKVIEGEIKDE